MKKEKKERKEKKKHQTRDYAECLKNSAHFLVA